MKKIFYYCSFIKKRTPLKLLVLTLFLSTTLINCYNNENSTTASINSLDNAAQEKGKNNFHLSLVNSTFDNQNIKSILINIERIEINSEKDGWFTIVDYGENGRIIDVLLFENGLTSSLGYLNLEPGIYNQIRIHLKNNNLILVEKNGNNSLLPLKIPSSSQSGVKLVRSFEIKEYGLTSIIVNFDAKKSIHYNKGQGYIMRPTIKIDSVQTSAEATLPVEPDSGGEITILNEISLQIPPGALDEKTDISIQKIGTTYKMPFSSTNIINDYYAFAPEGFIFNQDIKININYLDSKIQEKNISEENLKVYAIHSDNGEWQQLPGTVNMDSNIVSATTNQLAIFGVGGPPAEAPWIDPASVVKASDGTNTSQVPLKIKASINDADGVQSATLSYKIAGSLAFYSIEMTSVGSNWYEAEIPLSYLKDQLSPTGIEVFIEAIDASGNVSFAPVTASAVPHLYEYNPDSDNDGMNDRWEVEMGLDITIDDSEFDPDNDGFSNHEEYVNNTNPLVPEITRDPEDIESLCVVNKENHFWKGDNWNFVMIGTDNNVLPTMTATELNIDYDIDISRFYIVETYYIRYSYKTRNTSGTIGPVPYFDPSTRVRLYDDFVSIDSFYEEFQRQGYLETWTPLPIYIQFDINYTVNAHNTSGGSYSEPFHLFYQDY